MALKKSRRFTEPRKKRTRNGWLRTPNEKSQNGMAEPEWAGEAKYAFRKVSKGNQLIIVRFIYTSLRTKPISN